VRLLCSTVTQEVSKPAYPSTTPEPCLIYYLSLVVRLASCSLFAVCGTCATSPALQLTRFANWFFENVHLQGVLRSPLDLGSNPPFTTSSPFTLPLSLVAVVLVVIAFREEDVSWQAHAQNDRATCGSTGQHWLSTLIVLLAGVGL